jgi:hypothetical protein
MVGDVAALVDATALDQAERAEHLADGFAQSLAAVDHEQDPGEGIEAAVDQIRQQAGAD